jgi:hypothetical protein
MPVTIYHDERGVTVLLSELAKRHFRDLSEEAEVAVLKYLEEGQEAKGLPQPLLDRVRQMHTGTRDPNSEIFYLSQETYKTLLPVAESHNRSSGREALWAVLWYIDKETAAVEA